MMISDDVRETIRLSLEASEQWGFCVGDIADALNWILSLPTMPQAPWADAPEWAQWWAVDPDSIAYWFEVKPMFELGFWYCGTERKEKEGYYTLNLGLDHRMSLQERPRETA